MQTAQHVGAYFPLRPGTKEPMVMAWQVVVPGQYQAVGSYGEALTADDLILDADPRNYPPGRDVLGEILAKWPEIQPTKTIKTPSGGYHVRTKKPPELALRKHQAEYPGVDFLSVGHYVVGPGSTTIAGTYVVEVDAPIKACPLSFLESLQKAADASVNGADINLANTQPFIDSMKVADPPVQGSRGINAYKHACRGRDLALPLETVYAALRDWWNPRGMPPETDAVIYQQCERAYKYAKNALGSNTAEAKFTPDMAVAPVMLKAPEKVTPLQDFKDDKLMAKLIPTEYQTDKNGNPTNTLANVMCALAYHSDWKGRFAFNQFTGNEELRGSFSWKKAGDMSIDKMDIAHIKAWFSTVVGLEVANITVLDAVCAVAAQNSYHPVLDYFNSHVWDGVPRLDTFFRDTLGVEDTPLNRAISKCTVMGLVKRIHEPGCKYDQVVILEGRQGIYKSAWIKAFGDPWTSASELNRGDKDSYQNLKGRAVVELPEINSTFTKVDFAWLKGIITNATDVYRASFGRVSKAVPRESIFLGSINASVKGWDKYLKDEENRRFWPIECGRINLELTRKIRDQVFAEAVHRYKAGELVYITDPVLLAAAKVEQDKRKEQNPLVDLIAGWCATRTEPFTLADIAYAHGYDARTWKTYEAIKMRKALGDLGYSYTPKAGSESGTWWHTPPALTWDDVL